MRGGAPWLVACLVLGCATGTGPIEVGEGGGIAVPPDLALSFQRRAEGFYLRLAGRRFNTLETFNDFILRDHFESRDLFFDYYADLAQALHAAYFEKSRPERIVVEDFAFETPRSVRVKVLFEGDNGRPLRPGGVELVRVDQWEWVGETWVLRPGKL